MPASTKVIPIHVSAERPSAIHDSCSAYCIESSPLAITFPSTHHSPKTVKRNANELVIGTVKLSSSSIHVSPYFNQLHISHPSGCTYQPSQSTGRTTHFRLRSTKTGRHSSVVAPYPRFPKTPPISSSVTSYFLGLRPMGEIQWGRSRQHGA